MGKLRILRLGSSQLSVQAVCKHGVVPVEISVLRVRAQLTMVLRGLPTARGLSSSDHDQHPDSHVSCPETLLDDALAQHQVHAAGNHAQVALRAHHVCT